MVKRISIWSFMIALIVVFSVSAIGCGSSDNDDNNGTKTDGDVSEMTEDETTTDGDYNEQEGLEESENTEDTQNPNSELRNFFCSSDADCLASETCMALPGFEERICQPRSLVRFVDATTFIIDTSDMDYSITENTDGTSSISVKGFVNISSPGDPNLPSLKLAVLIPPDADPESVQLQVLAEEHQVLDGTYDIEPAGPANYKPGTEDAPTYEDWIKDKTYIVDGRNTLVYEEDAMWPDASLRVYPYMQMRKWRFVVVEFFPFRTNPVSKQLELTNFIKVHISTAPAKKFGNIQPVPDILLADDSFDDDAAEMFINYNIAKPLYTPRHMVKDDGPKADYVIITTKKIRSESNKLEAFAAHKRSIGYKVLIVDEDTWGASEGKDGPEKVRNWLKENYAKLGIQYVLLFADPNDTEGPAMRTCWPRYAKNGKEDWERTPTDAYYADLTGNWDKDGDGIWCEFGRDEGDTGRGGIDLTPELYVGRIPVYRGKVEDADTILQRTIDYEIEQDIEWRHKVLLPNPISDYSNEEDHADGGGVEVRKRFYAVDGAVFAERMKRDFIKSRYKVSSTTLYETRGPEPSRYTPDIPFSVDNVLNEWKKGYGLISWWAHGNTTSAAAKVWKQDTNGDGIAQMSEKDWEDFAYSYTSADRYNPEKPAFTSQVSCLNSRPDRSNNLSYTLLVKGAAIATSGATSVTLYSPSWRSPNYHRMDNVSFGYYYTKNIVKNYQAGRALAKVRSMPTSFSWGDGTLMNELSFNLYGDPSLALFTTYSPSEVSTDPKLEYRGHAFEDSYQQDGDDALRWLVNYKFVGDDGVLKVSVRITDEDGNELSNDGEALGIANTHQVVSGIPLEFDGDNPDVFVMKKELFSFLGFGTFNLKYILRFVYETTEGDEQELLTTSPRDFSIEFVDESSQVQTIQIGSPVSGTLDEDTPEVYFKLEIEQTGTIVLDLDGPEDADFDLYIKRGQNVDTSNWDKRGYTSSADEHIELADAEPGEYAILVNRYRGNGEFTLLVQFTPAEQVEYDELILDDLMEGDLTEENPTKIYKFTAPSDGTLTLLAEGDAGSILDLLIQKNSPPDGDYYFDKSLGDTANPELESNITAGEWYIMVRSRSGAVHFNLMAGFE